MIAEQPEEVLETRPFLKRPWSLLNLTLSILLIAAGIWYLLQRVSLSEIAAALAATRPLYIGLSLAVVMATLLAKAWRWQLLLAPGRTQVPLPASFWSLMLGQYVNLLVPFLRMGEIARAYAINRMTQTSKARALSTIAVEKTLDLLILGITSVLLISTIVLPNYVGDTGITMGAAAFIALALLYFLAYRVEFVVRVIKRVARWLPDALERLVVRIAISGLEGLSALRDRRTVLAMLGLSAAVGVLSVLTPWILFPALDIRLGLAQATLIHVVVTLALVPPSTPGKIVVFDGTVAFLLAQLGLEDAPVIATYTIIFHLVVLIPQVLLGSLATTRTRWRWSQMRQDMLLRARQ